MFAYFLPVTMMTVKDITHLSPQCPYPSEEVDDVAMITISDRKAELALMDQDFRSCIFDDGQSYQFLVLMAYIYTPFPVDDLQVDVWVTGLPCMDSRLTVYRETKSYGIAYKQCALMGSEILPDAIRRCSFICYNACHSASVAKIHVKIENFPQMMELPIKICEISIG